MNFKIPTATLVFGFLFWEAILDFGIPHCWICMDDKLAKSLLVCVRYLLSKGLEPFACAIDRCE